MVTDKGKFVYLVKDAKGAMFLAMVSKAEDISQIEGVQSAQWVREFQGKFIELPAWCTENGFQIEPTIHSEIVSIPDIQTEYPDFPDLPD